MPAATPVWRLRGVELEEALDEGVGVVVALAGGQVELFLIGKSQHAELGTLAGGGQGQHPTNFAAHIELTVAGRPHLLRGAYVEQQQHLLLALLLVGFHERAVALARYGPVDGPHLVAVLVEAHVVEFQPRALEYGVKVALQLGIYSLENADFHLPQAAHKLLERRIGRLHGV